MTTSVTCKRDGVRESGCHGRPRAHLATTEPLRQLTARDCLQTLRREVWRHKAGFLGFGVQDSWDWKQDKGSTGPPLPQVPTQGHRDTRDPGPHSSWGGGRKTSPQAQGPGRKGPRPGQLGSALPDRCPPGQHLLSPGALAHCARTTTTCSGALRSGPGASAHSGTPTNRQ